MKKIVILLILPLLGGIVHAQISQADSFQACEEMVVGVQARNKVQGFSCQKGIEKPAMYVVMLKGADGVLVGMPKPADELVQIQCYKPYIKNMVKKFDGKFVYSDGEFVVTESVCSKQ
jgi:hypothetical protein